MNRIPHYINHIAFVVDRSGSMQHLADQVVKVFDNQIKQLAIRSKEVDQETRATIYLFDDKIDNIVYDKDVLRLPSLKGYYEIGGSTALIDATLQAISDLQKTPELYDDHAFLIYVLTDGQNRENNHLAAKLAATIKGLPENYTVAAFVPDALGIQECKRFGFSRENIAVWSTDNAGMSEVGNTIAKTTDTYFAARAQGVRGTKGLFSLDASKLSSTTVTKNLTELSASQYDVLLVRTSDNGKAIKEFVEAWTKNPYRVGAAYFQLTKPEKIQASKVLAIQNIANGKVYSGANARSLLGLPNYEVKVSPADTPDYRIFVQSTSVNRKLVANTQLIVMK